MSSKQNPPPIKIGVAGSGIFAQKAHRPAILGTPDLKPTAVFSRSLENGKAFARALAGGGEAPAVFDDYDTFLEQGDFAAVDIVLPTPIAGEAVRKALAAGKHVLSEKPIAATCPEGQELIDFWRALDPRPVWQVSENWRLDDAFVEARRLLDGGEVGDMLLIRCDCIVFRPPDSPYEQSDWRQADMAKGGWLIDIGPHVIAALRIMFGDIQKVGTADRVEHTVLDGHGESICATLNFSEHVMANLSFVRAIKSHVPPVFEVRIEVLGTKRRLIADRNAVSVYTLAGEQDHTIGFQSMTVNRAMEVFSQTVQLAPTDNQSTPLDPEAALSDLAAIEAIRALL